MNPVALGVSGRIGSGKTTLANALVERLACSHAGFGQYVRNVAEGRGLDSEDRRVLQDLGDELIAGGWESFCGAVLQSGGYSDGSVVVDGIRHVEAIDTMRRILAPLPWRLVAIDLDQEARSHRLQEGGIDMDDVGRAEAHPNEREVEAVLKRADYRISGDLSIDVNRAGFIGGSPV
ncbi:MAG: AAA family ATPase [Actinomycetota bacterium]